MATGLSLILLATGAIIVYAINASVSGVNIDAIGAILMLVGGLGLVVSLLAMASIGPFVRHGHDHY